MRQPSMRGSARWASIAAIWSGNLGTLIAARFAAEQPRRVLSLTLAGVARGHGRLPPPERQRLLAQRLDDLAQLGPQGMAAKRGPRLLGPEATETMRRTVIEIMARIPAEGYAQAARMLSTGDITADLVRLSTALPIQIMVGQADVITPPESNREIAAAIPAASVHVVPGAGHALYLEKPAEFNRLVSDFAATRSAG
jgi:pimeloyl-ACP methyl ester carboxylesterase